MSQEFGSRDYFRFEIELGEKPEDVDAPNDDMDDARPENIKKLESLAERLMDREKSSLKRLIDQLKKPLAVREDLT